MTTPAGVPNLPVGALTLDTLGKVQDQTVTAFRAWAGEHFPAIFDGSTGGTILSDLTPFGIITHIWAGFNSVVANADPADITGPEDLPGLLLQFIEGLPVIGQLVGLLEAIGGYYTGDDAVLLAVQEIFDPIRKLLQLVAGADVGFPTVEEITVGWTDLADALIARTEEFAALIDGVLGTGHTAEDLVAYLTAIPADLSSLQAAIVSALNGVGSNLAAVETALANIPFLNVLSPWLTNIGAGVVAFLDSIVAGLTLEASSGGNPAQAGQAGTLIANAVNSNKMIAQSVAATIAAQAISNPAYFGIDPSAAVSYPLQTLAGAAAPTINVTQSSPAAIYVDTPNGGIKKSIAWLGDGTLTNITGMYINVYSVNTSTGVATWMWSSDNIISAVSGGAVPLWNYANIPLANYITTAQGQKYVAEIQVLGSGTYKIVGITGNWLNANTAVTVQTQGATRTPVTNQASVSSQTGGDVKAPSWTLTTVAGDNCILVDLVAQSNTAAITALSVTCGGVAMTQKAFTANWDTAGQWSYTAQFELHNTLFAAFSAGAKTIAVTTTGGGTSGTQCAVYGNATSYQNISAVSSATTTTGTTANPSQTASGLTANSATITHSVLGSVTATFSAGNQNVLANINGALASLLAQDQLPYATSVTFTGTNGSAGGWGGSVVTLTSTLTTPLQVPASTFTPTGSNNLPWFAMCGSAGVSQHIPETTKWLTSGSKTFTVPAWAQAVAAAGGTVKFDIVFIGGGGGGDDPVAGTSGGNGGTWYGITLTYGAPGGIPLTTTTFSITIGAGGATGSGGHDAGFNGADTTASITGYGSITGATGGTGSGYTSGGGLGASPGDFTFNTVLYYGGLETSFGVGSSPGGGGSINADGAPGAGFITTYQDA